MYSSSWLKHSIVHQAGLRIFTTKKAAKQGIFRRNIHLYHLWLNKSPSLLNVLLELRQAGFQKLLLFRQQFSQLQNLLNSIDLWKRIYHHELKVSLHRNICQGSEEAWWHCVQAKTCWKRTKCCWAAQIRSRLESSVSNLRYRQLWRGIQHLESSVSNWRGKILDSTGYVRFWVNKCKQQVKETSQGCI